jgi:cytochrome c biogenesis protein CcmG, thiol:disulfide interchange protein DsbE
VNPTRSRLSAVFLGLALVLAACSGGAAREAAGPPVPDRIFTSFDGEEVSLRDHQGVPMVVNLFASWCPPCVAEMPEFERVHQAVRDEVRFVGVNTQDTEAAARELVARTGVTYDLGFDPDGALFRDLEVVAMPSTFFVAADGTVVHRHAGILSEQRLRDLIDEHLVGG